VFTRWRRISGIGVLASGFVCPCHVLAGAAAILIGAPLLSPAAQDGLHAVYVPAAVIVGAGLLRLPSGRASWLSQRRPASATLPTSNPTSR